MEELYDLQADPFQMENIIESERGRAALPALQQELGRLVATGSPGAAR